MKRTPLRPKRKTSAERERIAQVRAEVYARDGESCTVCHRWLPLTGSVWERAHMAHVASAGRGGVFVAENLRVKCFACHITVEHSGWRPQ